MVRENESQKYIESSFDQGDSLLNRTSETYKYTGLQPVISQPGQRQVPGHDGFRLADTPQAWVFIQKKEWMDESWTYTTTDKTVTVNGKKISISDTAAAIESARSELSQLRMRATLSVGGIESQRSLLESEESKIQAKIQELESDLSAARTQLAKIGSQLQYDGKVSQINIRSALGNIITRKLDWMNDHEKFTKIMPPTNQQVEMIRFEKNRKEIEKILLDDELLAVNNNVAFLTESLSKWKKDLAYWEKIRIQARQKIDRAQVILKATVDLEERQKLDDLITYLMGQEIDADIKEVNVADIIRENAQKLQDAKDRQDKVASTISDNLKNFKLTFTEESDIMYAPTVASGSGYTRYYSSPIFKTRTTEKGKAIVQELEDTKVKLEEDIKNLLKQVRGSQSSQIKQLTERQREYIETLNRLNGIKETQAAQIAQSSIVIENGDMAFNGVMELANVSSINTTVTLQGEGSASFVVENPQNIFFISRDDVDLALTENPFLTSPRTLEGMVYYRGRFFPEHIVSMLTSRKGASVDLGHLSFTNESGVTTQEYENIKTQLAATESALINVSNQLRLSPVSAISSNIALGAVGTLLNAVSTPIMLDLVNKRATLQSELDALTKRLKYTESLMYNQNNNQNDRDKNTKEQQKLSEMNLIRQTLLKYYVGKTIFQVLDRVYIWTTSPSRTLHRLNRTGAIDQFAIEDPSSIALSQQLSSASSQIESIDEEIYKLTVFINSHTTLNPEGQEIPPEKRTIVAEFGTDSLGKMSPKIFTVNDSLLSYSRGQRNLDGPGSIIYLGVLIGERGIKSDTLSYLKKQINSSDQSTAARTFNKIPSARSKSEAYRDQANVIGEYESRYLGLEEDRVQVFQGVVSTVKLLYGEGKYTININCRDNMVFLSMSRIMIKPSLRADQGPQGILQDPIWRNNELSGCWKNGILVADYAFVNDEVAARQSKKIKIDRSILNNTSDNVQVGVTEGRTAVMPFVTSLPFARIDAANLLSFIITGIPYNFEQFLKNAAFGGRWIPERVSGVSDQRSTSKSFFSYLKSQIGEVNDRLGDFEPYINLKGEQFDTERLTEKSTAYNVAVGVAAEALDKAYRIYIVGRMKRYIEGLNQSAQQSYARSISNSSIVETTPLLSIDLKTFNAITKEMGDFNELIPTKNVTFIDYLTNTIIAFAKEHYMSEVDPTRAARSGVVAGNQKQIESLYDYMQLDSGAWKRIYALITFQVRAQGEAGKKETVIEFIKNILTIQPAFSEEFLALSIAASNLKDFENIRVDLESFLKKIQSQASTIKGEMQDGAQSTIEKIVRCEKKNFLVISDEYTLDLNLQAYQTEISKGNPNLFQSEWETPLSICKRAADQVDFEFYADEDGNLQFKPPTYNRILKEHFGLISETDETVRDSLLIKYGGNDGQLLRATLRGAVVYNNLKVEFITQLNVVTQQLKNLKKELESTQIVKATGNQSRPIQKPSDTVKAFTENAKIPSTKKVVPAIRGGPPTDKRVMVLEGTRGGKSDVEYPTEGIDFEIKANKNAKILHIKESDTLLNIEYSVKSYEKQAKALVDSQEYQEQKINLLRAQSEDKETQRKPEERSKIESDLLIAKSELERVNNEQRRLTLTIDESKFSQKVSLYEELITQVESLLEGTRIVQQKVRDKANNVVDNISMFTDENRIHRIADFDLISYDLEESPPRFTYIELTGAPELIQLKPAEIYWAGGVDYDNWRNYGFLSENIQRAYFHSGASARTYIRALLGRERGRVFSGSVSVRGDSKYRVGDCVFIESIGMYYYIISVSHVFSYGQSYTTNLTLAYGRRIGELIPHPFDALGKIMIETYQSDVEDLLSRERMVNENSNAEKVK